MYAIKKIRDILGLERNILVLCTTAILLNLAQAMYGPFLSPYFQSVGAATEVIGVIFSIMAIANALVMLTGGHLSDIYGRKMMTVLGSLFMAIFIFPLYFVGLWYLAVICLIMVNFGMNIYRPGAYALIVESLPAEKRATGFSSMGFIAGLGGILAPTIAGYLSLGGDYRLIFLLASLVLFIMTVSRQLLLRETKHRKMKTKQDTSKSPSEEKLGFLEKLKLTWNSGASTRAYILYSVISSLSGSIAGPYFALLYLNAIGLDQLQYGWLVSASLTCSLITQIPGGKVSDRFGRKPLMLISMVTGTLATFAITQTRDFTLLLLIQIASSTVGGLSSGAFYTLPAELVKKEYRGTALGVFNSFGRIAGAIGPLIGSLIVAKYSFGLYPRFVFYASVLLSIPSVIVFAIFVKETLRKNTRAPAEEKPISGKER